MKERPIIFSGEMVRAILDGRKTQTRRIVKYIPALGSPDQWCHRAGRVELAELIGDYRFFCPYGQPGNRLWVKEAWFEIFDPNTIQPTGTYCYRATYEGEEPTVMDDDGWTVENKDGTCKSAWKSPLHMPRWASRITLEITNIRVERLQDISEEDAKAEGCLPLVEEDGSVTCGRRKTVFTRLWNSLHKKDGFDWASNPFVWVIEFNKI